MRLLRYSDDCKLEFTSDLGGGNAIPPYAILSHTWQPGEEFTYEDMMRGDDRSFKKSGYTKILLFAQQAKRDGLEYFWVDTCCIDKADQVELRKAISSMFRWYQHASKCYVYMPDVSYKKRKADSELAAHPWATDFRASRWFTRGWTLQELLAPRSVEFFSQEWKKLGDKVSLQTYIQEATRIPTAALEGASLLKFSIEERLKWNEHRKTTVPEDTVYCLIGIMGAQMTPFYDEGANGAFTRLMHEARIVEQCLRDLQPSDPYDDKKRIEDTKGGLLRGSYIWILKDTTFQQWFKGLHSRLLWIKGDAGKGKTMLACGIIDELKRSKTAPFLFFFCQDTDSRINSATGVLRGLIHQLVSQQPSLMSHLRKKYDQAGSTLFQDANAWVALSNIFTEMTKDLGNMTSYIIVDGLDECVVDLPKLLDLIVSITLLSTNVKWLVSSRNEAHIEQKFKTFSEDSKLSLELDQNAEQVARAVDVYIDHKLSQLESLQEISLREQVRCEFRQKANGTFLWVALMMQELEAPESWDPLAVVQEAPTGLDQLYDRMMGRIQQLKGKTVELCQLLLSTAVVAYRPLYLVEMGSLRRLHSPATALADTVRKVITFCGSFLTIRNEQIYFVHQSAKDYLSAKMETAVLPTRGKMNNDLFTQSLRLMSSTLHYDMYKLVDVGLHIDEVTVPAPDPLAAVRYSCVHWVDHLHPHNSILSGRPRYIESLQEGNIVHVFLQKYFLYWLEALSLCRSMSAGVLSMTKLVELLKGNQCANALTDLIHDAHRFVMYSKGAIETSALQAYVSALLLSPRSSLVKNHFRHEEPNDITVIPAMDDGWSMCLQTLEGHKTFNLSVAVSPDSTHVASSSDDGTIIIWHVSSGTYLQTLNGHFSATKSVAFSPNSTQLASASLDRTVKIWNISSGACLRTLKGHGHGVLSVAFSPDSFRLASASYDTTVKIWDASSGACLHTIYGHTDAVQSVTFSHDSMHVLSSSADNTVKIWKFRSGACIKSLQRSSDQLLSVVFSPDASQLASASWNNTIKIWDLRRGACTQTLKGHSGKVVSIAFSHDSARLASASEDRTIKIWDLCNGTPSQTLKDLGGEVMSVVFFPDSTWLASASIEGLVKIWDTSCSACPLFQGHSNLVQSVAFSPDLALLASASKDSTVKIWGTSTGLCLQTLIGHCGTVNSIAFSQGSELASGSNDRAVKIWDISSGACLRTLRGRIGVVNSVAYSHDSSLLASSDHDVRIWDACSGMCLQTITVAPLSAVKLVAFSHDSTRLASVAVDFTIMISDTRSGACLQKLEGFLGKILPVSWSRSCQLVWASNDRTVKIWDAMSGVCLRTLEIQSDLVSSAAHTSVLAFSRSDETVTQLPTHPEATFRSNGTWIFKNDKKLLWLPTEYRPASVAVAGRCVALGAGSGKVWICRF